MRLIGKKTHWRRTGFQPNRGATTVVNMAEVYAPTAMNPACPRENCPVKPLMRLRLEASTTLTPTPITTSRK